MALPESERGLRQSCDVIRFASSTTGYGTLHIDLTDPLGYPVTGASTGSGEEGTVVSDVDERSSFKRITRSAPA
jgi:hypothetical protein